MKRKLFKIVPLLMAVVLPLTLQAVNIITYTATYDTSKLSSSTDTLGGLTYATVHYDGLNNCIFPGEPSLPVDYIMFSVPYNATNFIISATCSNTIRCYVNSLVYPCQAPRFMSDTSEVVTNQPNNTTYNSNNFFPMLDNIVWVAEEGFLAGENHIVKVAVMPIRYKHNSNINGIGSNTLLLSRSVSLTLSYDLSSNPSLAPLISVNQRSEGYRLVQNMVVNPDSVISFAPPQSTMNSPFIPNLGSSINSPLSTFPYLIVTTSSLKTSLKRFVALKRQKGLNVKVATVDEIVNDPYAQYGDIVSINGTPVTTFTDSAGKIRQYLKLAYWYNSTKYLLIAGTDVPFRIRGVPTDLYYSDLNSDWKNSYTIDKYPELFVGRLLAKTADQINNYTDKLFRYELNPGNGDYSYLRRALYTESYDMRDKSRGLGKGMNTVCPDSTILREIEYGHYPKGRDVIDSLESNRVGFWATFNHGEPSCIATYGVKSGGAYTFPFYRLWADFSSKKAASNYEDPESDNGLNNILGKDYPMISYSMSCTTMPFDLISEKYSELTMNFGESFTTGENYGGPAYLGNTRDGYIGPSSILAEHFGKRIEIGDYKIGKAEALSKVDYSTDYNFEYIPLVHNLLGDPDIEMWSDIPQLYSGIEIYRNDNSITISGIDADSTIVAYSNNDFQIGSDTISNYSVTLNGISPNSSIMLYKHNYIPYITPLSLQNTTLSNSQYVIASDLTAGNAIDNNRTNGNVIIPNGVEYEIEATGTVRLEDGFKVEQGALFAVYPSSF